MTEQGKQVIMLLVLASSLFFINVTYAIIAFIVLAVAFGIGYILIDAAYENLKNTVEKTTTNIKKILNK